MVTFQASIAVAQIAFSADASSSSATRAAGGPPTPAAATSPVRR